MTQNGARPDRLPPDLDAESLIDGSLIGVIAINANSTIVYANDGVERILGYTPTDLTGDSLATLIPSRLQQDHFESFTEYQQTGERHVDWDHVEVPALDANGEETPIAIAFREFHSEPTNLYVGIFVDRTELEEREQELERHKAEMEFFNDLLQHDVLNAATIIRGRSQQLADELEGEEQEYAETIAEWSENISGTIQRVRSVLDTLTNEEPDFEQVKLSRMLKQQVENVSATYPDVDFPTQIPSNVSVRANEMLSDVFKNLLTNAVLHNRQTDELRVETTVEIEENTVTVRVADNGKGVPDELKEDVFRRGDTGDSGGDESGFGLFFVDAMVTAYGGEVYIEDNEMGGATFVIELPRVQDRKQGD